jgi:hypothetical protein
MRIWTLFFLLISIVCRSQNTIGLPDVINYPKQSYSAGLQNWDIKQDNNGIIYIANNEGLLSFDGKYWNLYPLPNKTIVRSVEIGPDDKIYAGGQDEIGYFTPSSNGKLAYTSLTKFIDEKDRSFGDVWDIASFKKDEQQGQFVVRGIFCRCKRKTGSAQQTDTTGWQQLANDTL